MLPLDYATEDTEDRRRRQVIRRWAKRGLALVILAAVAGGSYWAGWNRGYVVATSTTNSTGYWERTARIRSQELQGKLYPDSTSRPR